MQAVLVMFRSDGDRRSFSLTRDITVVGRREDCDLRIPLGEISRKHCRLVRDGDTLRLEDLGSSNGTYHNGQRVQEAMLSPGDSIQVGPLVFVLQIDGVPVDDDLAPITAPTEEAQEGDLLADDNPLQPTAQSEYGMGNLPTLDEEPAELETLDDSEVTPLPEPQGDAPMGLTSADSELETTPPLNLEAPAGDDLAFDDLEAVPELESSAAGEPHEPGAPAEHAEGEQDPLALDDLELEQAPLELDDEDEGHHGQTKLDAEHESPHTH